MMHAFFAFTATGEPIANPSLDSVVNQMVGLAEKAYLEGITASKDETFHDEPLLKEGIAPMLAHRDPTDPLLEGDHRIRQSPIICRPEPMNGWIPTKSDCDPFSSAYSVYRQAKN